MNSLYEKTPPDASSIWGVSALDRCPIPPSWGRPAGRPFGWSGSIQDLHDPSPPINKHPVAGAQAHRGVAAADDGRNPQLAGEDGRVRQRRSHIGDNGRGTWKAASTRCPSAPQPESHHSMNRTSQRVAKTRQDNDIMPSILVLPFTWGPCREIANR